MVAEGKDVRKSVAAREEGNMKFQEGSYQVVTPNFVTITTKFDNKSQIRFTKCFYTQVKLS